MLENPHTTYAPLQDASDDMQGTPSDAQARQAGGADVVPSSTPGSTRGKGARASRRETARHTATSPCVGAARAETSVNASAPSRSAGGGACFTSPPSRGGRLVPVTEALAVVVAGAAKDGWTLGEAERGLASSGVLRPLLEVAAGLLDACAGAVDDLTQQLGLHLHSTQEGGQLLERGDRTQPWLGWLLGGEGRVLEKELGYLSLSTH
jgi:hypothetical protein